MFNRNIVLPINLRNECAKMFLRCMKGSGNKSIKIVLSESFMPLQRRALEQSVCGHFQDGAGNDRTAGYPDRSDEYQTQNES